MPHSVWTAKTNSCTKNLHQQPREFFSCLGGRTQKVGYHRDGIGSSFDHRTRIRPGDAADGYQRLPGRCAGSAQSVQPDHGIRVLLGGCGEDRPEGDVVSGPASASCNCSKLWVDTPRIPFGPSTVRAPSGDRSSWPTCTPSKPAARHRSARSFMINLTTSSLESTANFTRVT